MVALNQHEIIQYYFLLFESTTNLLCRHDSLDETGFLFEVEVIIHRNIK